MTELFIKHLPFNAVFMVNGVVQSNPCKLNIYDEYIDVHVSVTIPPNGKLKAPIELMNALATVYANQRNIVPCKGVCLFSVPTPNMGIMYVNGKSYSGEVLEMVPTLPEHEYVEVRLVVAGAEVYKVHFTTLDGEFSPSLPRVEVVYLRLKNVPKDCVVLLNDKRVMPYSSFPMVIEVNTRFSLLVRNADRIELDLDVQLDEKFSLDIDVGARIAERRGASAPDENINVFGDVFAVIRVPFAAFAGCVALFAAFAFLFNSPVVGFIGVPVSIFVTVYAFCYVRTKS
jgi:hypothetical protein